GSGVLAEKNQLRLVGFQGRIMNPAKSVRRTGSPAVRDRTACDSCGSVRGDPSFIIQKRMPTDSERLRQALEAFTIPRDGRNYSVADYFQLPAESRVNDEADAVDMRLALVLLDFLGYNGGDW